MREAALRRQSGAMARTSRPDGCGWNSVVAIGYAVDHARPLMNTNPNGPIIFLFHQIH
jgi:hypothetical protein